MRTIWTPSYPLEIPFATASLSMSLRCSQCRDRTQMLESSKTMNPPHGKPWGRLAARTYRSASVISPIFIAVLTASPRFEADSFLKTLRRWVSTDGSARPKSLASRFVV